MPVARLISLLLLLTLWAALTSGARAEPARAGAIVLSAQSVGVRLVARIPRRAYAPNALIAVHVRITNDGTKPVGLAGFPQFCISQNPTILVTDRSGKQYPTGITPLEYPPCPFPLGPMLAPGRTVTATEYAIARASHVQVSLRFLPAGGSSTANVVTKVITLTTGSSPAATATMHTSASGVYAVIHRPKGVRGPMLYEAGDTCPGGQVQSSHIAYLWTSTTHTRLTPSCPAPSRWVAVAGWVGYPVAEITYGVPQALSRTGSQRASCAGSSPRAVVRAYYAAINRHQAADAEACITPYWNAQAKTFVDPDWENIVWVRKLHLRSQAVPAKALPGNVPPRYARPFAASQVAAQFVVRYRQVIDSPNGPTIRFIYTVKQRSHSPWRIAAVGSGP